MRGNGPTLRSWIGEHWPRSAQPEGSSTCVSLMIRYFSRSSSRAASPGANVHQCQFTRLSAMSPGVTPRSSRPAHGGTVEAAHPEGYGGAIQKLSENSRRAGSYSMCALKYHEPGPEPAVGGHTE